MSCLLAIELSTPRGNIAVTRDGEVVFEQDFTSHRSHNSMLYAPLAAALEVAGADLEKIVIGTGPGSYTGVRISIAAAHGVALSRGVPVVGWPSITALSDAAEHLVIGDARRGKFYVATVRNGRLVDGVALHDEPAFRAWLEQHSHLPCFTSDPVVPLQLAGVTVAQPSAALLARHAVDAVADGTDVEPLYVQEAFVTKAKTPTMGTGS